MRQHERVIMLSVLDQLWKDHLLQMDHLKEGIGLRGYGQHDPLVEYKRESFTLFEEMMEHFEEETVRYLYMMRVVDENGDEVSYAAAVGGSPRGGNGGRRAAALRAGWGWEWECGRAGATPDADFAGRRGEAIPAAQGARTGAGAPCRSWGGRSRAAGGSRRKGRPQ